MTSKTTKQFREAFRKLPKEVQKQAREAYSQFQKNPYYSSLRFKKIHTTQPIYSVRISLDYRALAVAKNNEFIWFWIGSHADYDRLCHQLK